MGLIRPATPGFLCTLTATILLGLVSFCVPLIKSLYFLEASISIGGVNGSVTFGTLGYCLDLANGTMCSSPSVGYELDINGLVGNDLPIDIPVVVVKWITYALVLHIVAFALAGGSALFGLLAHIREMSMACCSTFVSGFAATVSLIAFIFDIVLFFVAKARINAIGRASIGNAVWLTLAAFLLLFFSGCFYAIGRCCITNRKPRDHWRKDQQPDQMQLDAVKAEADRKAKQAYQKEIGLQPLETQPLTARIEGDHVYFDQPYSDNTPAPTPGGYGGRPAAGGGFVGGGYVPGTPGNRAMDEYYNPTQEAGYPPQPHRQGSAHTTAPSSYAPSTYTAREPQHIVPPQPVGNQYLAAGSQQYADPNGSPSGYDHTSGGTTYHSAHTAYPSAYSAYDSYDQAPSQPQRQYSDRHGGQIPIATSPPPMPSAAYVPQQSTYYPAVSTPTPDRSYTLGGDGYGGNAVPPLPHQQNNTYLPYPGDNHSPSPINTSVPVAQQHTSPGGPRTHRTMSPRQHEDSPPGYDQGPLSSVSQPVWGSKT